MSSIARASLLGLGGGVVVFLVACGTSRTRDQSSAGDASANVDPALTGTFGGASTANNDGCSEEAKLVYVLSLEGDLYSFAPSAKKFTKVGALDCNVGAKKFIPISMSVDRDAVAWVNMREDKHLGDDTLFKVDTKTAACTPTTITGGMGGMGFSINEGSSDKETLYVIGPGDDSGGALMKVDFAQEKLVTVAHLQEKVDLELTGTGDGRLYGFLISQPLSLATVNKTTSAFSNRVTLTDVEKPKAPMFAFSFWGGDFYFYTATNTSNATTTNVTRYRPSDGSIDTSYMTAIGFHIVGAGVSTCAPTEQPK